MTRTSPPQLAFSSGEIDPLLHRRFDYQRFQTGMALCKGFLPLPQGGFTRAPGTLQRGYTWGNAAGVLIPFQFAADDAVILEFTPLRMRVWRFGALVMAGATPYELATPYDAASLPRLQWVQSADVIYMVDGLQAMRRLSRLALDNWTIAPQVFDKGPFRTQNLNKSRTITASAATGTITLSVTGAALFGAQDVGALMRLVPTDNTDVPLWTSNEALTVGTSRRYDRRLYQLVQGSNSGSNPPIQTEGDLRVDNATVWRYVSDDVGVVRITQVNSGNSALAVVLRTVPGGCVGTPTYRWSEGAWSNRYGYPGAIELYDQRLVAAATPSEPRTVWFSAIGDFADFGDGIEADDPFAYAIAGDGSVNRIQNLKRGRSGLHIFALGEEYSTRSDSRAQAIGPTSIAFGLDSALGSSPARPIAPDGNPIFISRDRRRVTMIAYSLEADANRAVALSLAAQHLGAAFFDQIVWQGSPQPIAWLRRSSGDLAAMIYDPAEEVLGWATLPVAGGFVESLAVSPDPTGGADILTMIVRRVVNGATVRFVEELAVTYGLLTGATPVAAACHLYAARQIVPGAPTANFAVPHLAGEQVLAWTDEGEFGPFAVPPGGSVTLPAAVGIATIGLFDPTHEAQTLDITAQAADGSTIGRNKRLHSGVGIGLHRTAQGFVQVVETEAPAAPRVGTRASMIGRAVAASLTEATTGVVAIDLPSGHAKELALRFTPSGGAPMTVAAVVPIVQEAGR